jgi:hypothetical protein
MIGSWQITAVAAPPLRGVVVGGVQQAGRPGVDVVLVAVSVAGAQAGGRRRRR